MRETQTYESHPSYGLGLVQWDMLLLYCITTALLFDYSFKNVFCSVVLKQNEHIFKNPLFPSLAESVKTGGLCECTVRWWRCDAVVMAYEPEEVYKLEEVYEYDDPLEFEIEQLKDEAGDLCLLLTLLQTSSLLTSSCCGMATWVSAFSLSKFSRVINNGGCDCTVSS